MASTGALWLFILVCQRVSTEQAGGPDLVCHPNLEHLELPMKGQMRKISPLRLVHKAQEE